MRITELKKQFLENSIYNIFGSMLLTGTIQLVLYPILSRNMESGDYGLAITLLGFTTLFTAVFGCSLHDCRLKLHQEYKNSDASGDYSFLFYIGAAANIIAVIILSKLYYSQIPIYDLVLLVVISLFAHFKLFFSVYFRIHFEFKKILIMSIFCTVGYLLGALLSRFTGIWQLSFLLGEFAGSVYVYYKSPIVKAPPKITSLFKTTSNVYLSLIFIQLLFNIPFYAERLFVYPILGGNDVAVYYTASFFGKIIGAVATPISSVLLSHYSRENEISLKGFWTANIVIFAITLLLIGTSKLLAIPITGIFYPTIIGNAIPYSFLANTAVIIFYAATMVYPAVLRFCDIRILLVIQTITIVIYILTSVILTKHYALIGFCYAMLLTNILNLMMLLILGSISIKKQLTILINGIVGE